MNLSDRNLYQSSGVLDISCKSFSEIDFIINIEDLKSKVRLAREFIETICTVRIQSMRKQSTREFHRIVYVYMSGSEK